MAAAKGPVTALARPTYYSNAARKADNRSTYANEVKRGHNGLKHGHLPIPKESHGRKSR